MAARVIKGAPIAEEIRAEIGKEVGDLKEKGFLPKLSVVLVGDDPGSVWYARNKVSAGEKIGVAVDVKELPKETPEADVVALVQKLNEDPNVHGILVELPLPRHINKANIINAINPAKDVGVGAYIAEGVLKACMLSVDINLPSIKTPSFRDHLVAERARLFAEAEELKLLALADVKKRL